MAEGRARSRGNRLRGRARAGRSCITRLIFPASILPYLSLAVGAVPYGSKRSLKSCVYSRERSNTLRLRRREHATFQTPF